MNRLKTSNTKETMLTGVPGSTINNIVVDSVKTLTKRGAYGAPILV